MKKSDIGLIGLAVMGENLVMNMESKGFTVSVFNRTTQKVTNFINGRAKGKNIVGTYSLEELEAALAERRDGERFVVPEAARIYKNNPSRINKEGKAVFARGLFAEEDEPEEAVLVGEEKEQ